jgi:hypothetical protein
MFTELRSHGIARTSKTTMNLCTCWTSDYSLLWSDDRWMLKREGNKKCQKKCLVSWRKTKPLLTCPQWRSQKLSIGGRSKSFNYKITKCSLFVWIFAPWIGSTKNKIQICVILLSRSHKKYNKAFIISF